MRNGEPAGELGLVLQKDFAWQDQAGAPSDPQAGNIPDGKRDVLRSADFNDGLADGFLADSRTWTVTGGRYQVAPTVAGGDAVSVFYVDSFVPSYFELTATINAVKPTGGTDANGYLIFDYHVQQANLLTESQVATVANEAVREWPAVLGSGDKTGALGHVSFVLVNDLPGNALAWSIGEGTVLIDMNAAGYGWFVDPTPSESSEYRESGERGRAGPVDRPQPGLSRRRTPTALKTRTGVSHNGHDRLTPVREGRLGKSAATNSPRDQPKQS